MRQRNAPWTPGTATTTSDIRSSGNQARQVAQAARPATQAISQPAKEDVALVSIVHFDGAKIEVPVSWYTLSRAEQFRLLPQITYPERILIGRHHSEEFRLLMPVEVAEAMVRDGYDLRLFVRLIAEGKLEDVLLKYYQYPVADLIRLAFLIADAASSYGL